MTQRNERYSLAIALEHFASESPPKYPELAGRFDIDADRVYINKAIIHCKGNVQSAHDGAVPYAEQHPDL